jgi:hypothetical protein
LKELKVLNEIQGFNTVFCDYVDEIQFEMPAEKTKLFKKYSTLSKIINAPFNVFNIISKKHVKLPNLLLELGCFQLV